MRTLMIEISSMGGTSFRRANLTNANFTHANLRSTDFREATITHTCWNEAKKLDYARVGDSILIKKFIRDLLITGNGYNKSYAGMNLQGANLAGANLNKANLKEADISQANLQRSNLEGANFTKAQALGTNFSNSYLTGACLEAWNIDSNTKLEQVDCQYVFLLEYSDVDGNGERRPHDPDKVFEPGDFAKFYKKITNTVQILLRNGLNPEVFNLAFQKLMVENPEITIDSIQTIEKKDDDILLTIAVPEGTDKGKLEHDFDANYKLQAALLAEKNLRIQDLKELAMLALSRDSAPIHIDTKIDTKTESKAMTNSPDSSRKLVAENITLTAVTLGDDSTFSGTIAHTINQLPDSPKPDRPGIKELLSQLQQAIETDREITPEQKAKALKQLQALATAGQDPKSGTMKDMADDAITMLKGIIASLPSAAALIKTCSELLPSIAHLFGL